MKQKYITFLLSIFVLFVMVGVSFVSAGIAPVKDMPLDQGSTGQYKNAFISLENVLGRSLVLGDNSFITTPSGPNFYLFSSNNSILNNSLGYLNVNTRGLLLPKLTPSSDSPGMIYYDTTNDVVKVYSSKQNKYVDIGTGGSAGPLKPTVALTGNSGSVGMVFKRDPADASGTNSPMLMFSGFANANVGYLSDKKIAKSFFKDLIPTANAMLPNCDPESFNCGGSGGSGGTGGGYTDPLTQPVWWMRQEGTQFVIKASDPSFTDVRDAFTLTKAGTLTTNDINLVNPNWSKTTGEMTVVGGHALGMDNYVEGWVECPPGYFMSAFRFGRNGDADLLPTIKCSKL